MSVRVQFAASAGRFASTLALATMPTLALASVAWSADHSAHSAHYAQMTPAQMRKMADQYWAAHRQVGVTAWATSPTVVATASIAAQDFSFSPPNVTIDQGDTVRWNWNGGIHTTTNGTDENDPNAGSMWSAPLDTGHRTFARVFTEAGTFPYFCAFHSIVMKGTITVNATTDVKPIDGAAGKIGFAAPPAPNPTKGGFAFRFALKQAGHVRADLFDAAGRMVTNLVDRDMGAGVFAASYNGRAGQKPGVYWIRLSVPGAQQSRSVVIEQ